MEKSHHHSHNADDFAINSVYLETFRKRKKKNGQKSKTTAKPEPDFTAYSAVPGMEFADSMDASDASAEGEARISKKQLSGASLMNQFYGIVLKQTIPLISKTVYDSFRSANKIAASSNLREAEAEQEKPQQSDGKDLSFEIDLLKIFRYLIRRWKSLCAIAVLGGVIGFLISSFLLTPKYTSIADLYITNKNTVDAGTVNINDINASQTLVDTYIVMLQTNSITDEVLKKLEEASKVASDSDMYIMDETKLLSYITFSSVNKTEVLRITVETESPQLSQKIGDVYSDIASKSLENIVGSGSVTILSHPKLPKAPSFPSIPKFTVIFAFLFGVVLVLIYMIRLATKVTISDEKSLSERYNIPVLGAVPDFFRFAKSLGISKKDVSLNNKLKKRNVDNEKIITTATILGPDTPFPIDSAYKSIRTNMMFRISTMGDDGVFVITSPTANDLKTTTTINLAISMAQMGAKVLLVDADLRNPSIYRYFKVSNKRGLSRVLMGFESFDESVFRDVRPGVDFISAGPSTPSPAELLGSNYMIDFVNTQSRDYDFVFIDTSPINLVADSLTLASMSSGIIITARENKTRFPELDRAMNSIKMAKANILGFILTDANSGDGSGYGYGYGYGYGRYGYGYGYGEGRKKQQGKKGSASAAADEDEFMDGAEDYDWENVVKPNVESLAADLSEDDEIVDDFSSRNVYHINSDDNM